MISTQFEGKVHCAVGMDRYWIHILILILKHIVAAAGQVQLAPLTRPPDALAQILKSSAPSAKDFRSYLRTYNNALPLAPMSCKPHSFSSDVPAMPGGGTI